MTWLDRCSSDRSSLVSSWDWAGRAASPESITVRRFSVGGLALGDEERGVHQYERRPTSQAWRPEDLVTVIWDEVQRETAAAGR